MRRAVGRSVGRRSDQQLIHPVRLRELEALAGESLTVRRALHGLRAERYQAMEVIREGVAGTAKVEQARGWLQCLDRFGELLLEVQPDQLE